MKLEDVLAKLKVLIDDNFLQVDPEYACDIDMDDICHDLCDFRDEIDRSLKYTYQRHCDHCKPAGDIIKTVTVKEVVNAENSDRLDVITFDEIGYQTVVTRGLRKVGDKVVFVPPECVFPHEIINQLEINDYLDKGRVRVIRLRKNRSEGMVLSLEDMESIDVLAILKWESLPPGMQGVQGAGCEFVMPVENRNPQFNRFYKMDNLLNNPHIFKPGEMVYVSEKIHGANIRFAALVDPSTNEYIWNVGTHNRHINNLEGFESKQLPTIYLEACERFKEVCMESGKNLVFYGELYGPGIQHLHYGLDKPEVKLFAITLDDVYITVTQLHEICDEFNFPCVKHDLVKFESVEQMRKLADAPSEYASPIREGIVITSQENTTRMAKLIGFNYLEQSGRTESH